MSAPAAPADTTREPQHYTSLAAAEEAAWAMLLEGAASRRAAFHQAMVATIGRHGAPRARTVVLRAADPARRTVRFHTDQRSGKFAELTHDPRCEVTLYDHDAKVQVRLRGEAGLHSCDATAAGLWDAMRDFSRACYRQPVGPGTALACADGAEGPALADATGMANFVAVAVLVHELEWLYLAAAGHRRAQVCYRGAGEGTEPRSRTWLAP